MSSSQLLKRIRKYEKTLRTEYHVKSLYLFGSFARGTASSKSDIDLVVEFDSSEIGMFEFVRLKSFLESCLGREVDLVTWDALKDWMKAEIQKDAIRAA